MQPEKRQVVKGSAERMRRFRAKLGLSQSQLARELGVATNTVARWERGDLVPSRIAELATECLLLKSQPRRRDQ